MVRIGHRGAAGWEPQNTISSFKKAIALDCDVIETDLHVCRSGEIVLCHDARIDKSSDGAGLIADLTLDELKSFDFGKGERIVQLEELLALAEGRVRLNLELKSDGSGIAAASVIEETIRRTSWNAEDFLITSFNHPELVMFHAELPSVPVGALIKSVLIDTVSYLDQLDVSVLVTSLEFINQSLVDDVHDSDRSVFVYTVNEPHDIDRMYELGVDGIISNYPDRVSKVESRSRFP